MIRAHTAVTYEREPLRTREVGWPTIALFLAVSTGVLVLFLHLPHGGPLGHLLDGPEWRQNLAVSGARLLLAVGVLLFGVGRLRPRDLGAGRRQLLEAVAVVGGAWGIAQLLSVGFMLATAGAVELDPAWAARGAPDVLAWAGVMFGATALYEELAFRGFLFPQLYLKSRGSPRVRFWAAALASQLVFGAVHIPGHVILRGMSGAELVRVVLLQAFVGLLLLLVYLRTRNLWVAVGFHGLINSPTPLFVSWVPWEPFLLLVLLGWPRLMRHPAHQGLAHVARPDAGPDAARAMPDAGGLLRAGA